MNTCRKNNNRFKKLKLNKRERERKRKTPQNYKSPKQTYSFITTIKYVTEKKKKEKIIYRTSQNIIITNVFLSHCCQSPFPCWESQSTSPPWDALQHCADLWTCCGGNSDSNLVLLLFVLASNVHSYQNQCIFFCGSSQ